MKFLSIFYHTITTHTHREPHALATPTVNFSSLGEKTGERRRIRKPDARARERETEREREREGPILCSLSEVQKIATSFAVTPFRRRSMQRQDERGEDFPTLLQMCSSFLKPPMPYCPFFFLSLLIFALCASVSEDLCLFCPLIFFELSLFCFI